MNLHVNELAPNFKALGSDNKEHSLNDYRGKKIILYFYPKDNTPGCTTEACNFRDNIEKIKNLNTVVLGISKDSLISHEKFINKLSLPFILLSDPNEDICKLYDVIKEKNMFGMKYVGIERSTFIINEDGIITNIFRKVRVKGHVEKVLEALNINNF